MLSILLCVHCFSHCLPYLGSVLLHTGWLVGLELVLELVLELEVELEANSELVGLMFAL